MNDIVGIGEYTYRIVEDWAKLPSGWKFADVHERRAVPALHAHRAFAPGRDLRLRRLRQCRQFLSPPGIAVDSRGDLYVGEVGYNAWRSLFPQQSVPAILRTLQKFEKVTVTN